MSCSILSVGSKILTTVCACTINALQGNVPAINLALGVAVLTHRTSFLANNVSTTIARYSLEWPVNLLSASCLVSELTVSELTYGVSELSCQRVDVSVSWFVSELSRQRVVCQRVGLSARCLWSRKITLPITAVDFSQFSLYSTGTALFCNDHMWQTQTVTTLLHALKGQTVAPFSLGWRLPFRVFFLDQ